MYSVATDYISVMKKRDGSNRDYLFAVSRLKTKILCESEA